MAETFESFSLMLRHALGDRLDPAASTFQEMFDRDGVMEFPFAYGDLPRRIEGREALASHLSMLATLITFDGMNAPTIIPSTNPDIVVLEFNAFGTGIALKEPYEQRYVSIIRTRNGRIVHYKDYWNPLAVLRALRGAAEVAKLTEGEMHHG
jgi:ketosteroid isomerase-like protein